MIGKDSLPKVYSWNHPNLPQPELLSFESHFSLSIHALPIFILTSFCNFIRYPTLIIMTQMTDDHYDTDDR